VLGRDWHIVSWFISGPIDLLSLIDSTHWHWDRIRCASSWNLMRSSHNSRLADRLFTNIWSLNEQIITCTGSAHPSRCAAVLHHKQPGRDRLSNEAN
jgi:hypothetical protein